MSGRLPGIEKLRTETALEMATNRPQYPPDFTIKGHIWVNGYDLARVEQEAYDAGVASAEPAEVDGGGLAHRDDYVPLVCVYCDSPDGSKWHRPGCSAIPVMDAGGSDALDG